MDVRHYQIIWGILLTLAGIGVFYRIPQVMPKLAEFDIFKTIFIKLCFYFIGVILIGGGIKKVYINSKKIKSEKDDE